MRWADGIEGVGIGLILTGLFLWWVPAALIVTGLVLVVVANRPAVSPAPAGVRDAPPVRTGR